MDIPTVGRATTAAPVYFRNLTTKIGDTTLRFKDGGFECTKPNKTIYKDIKAILANESKDMGPFISIGTGVSDVHLFPEKQGHLRHKWAEFRGVTKGQATWTKGAHDAMVHAAYPDNQKKFQYSRFDVGNALGAILMDEWKPSDRDGLALFTGKHRCSGKDTIKKIEAMHVALGAQNHPHLITLLASYRKKKCYHLIFPCADSNLRVFWRNNAMPNFDRETVLWSIKQMLGTADGLYQIHAFEVQYD
jgi:hypothetical protein